mgnify:FL=1
MTDSERAAIIGYLSGKGWTRLSDLRAGLRWPLSHYMATDLGACVNRLEREGVIRTTERGEPGFSVCLKTEVLL